MAATTTTETKKPVEIIDDMLNIKCVAQDRDEICFRLKTTTPFQKMFDAYASQTKLNAAALRFLFDGTRINPTQSPGALQMEDGDTIDVYMEQVGGTNESPFATMKAFCHNRDFDEITEGRLGTAIGMTVLSVINRQKKRACSNEPTLRVDLLDWWNTYAVHQIVKCAQRGQVSVDLKYDAAKLGLRDLAPFAIRKCLPDAAKEFLKNGAGAVLCQYTTGIASETAFEIGFVWAVQVRRALQDVHRLIEKRTRQRADDASAADALLHVAKKSRDAQDPHRANAI